MLPKEIVEIVQKYQNNSDNFSSELNANIEDIISILKKVNIKIRNKLYDAMDSKFDKIEEELHNDSHILRDYYESIKLLDAPKSDNTNVDTEPQKEISLPIFEKKVYPYLVDDDICPFCNTKLQDHNVYYQRYIDNKLFDEQIQWHWCPACHKLFALDYEIDNFDFNDTNILLNKTQYNQIPDIDIYSVVVLSNTLKCSSQHITQDFIAKVPVLNEDGQITYINVNSSYCRECNRFTILKTDFISIKDIVMAKVIDETIECNNSQNENFNFEQIQSKLTYYGYNVQTKKNISEKQRHIILASIIEAQIMSRREVIDHINTLIERGSKITSWSSATRKWKDDKKFVAEYKSDDLPEVIFNNIILKYKKPKY